MTKYCNRAWLARFQAEELELDDRLEFLYHLDECPRCWEAVYSATKAKHPHYYKISARKMKLSEKELRRIEAASRSREEVFEVA